MEIKVIGAGCKACDQLYDNVQQALAHLGLEASVEKVEDLVEIVKLGVLSAPALMVNGRLLVRGQVASARKIAALLSAEAERQ